MKKQNWNRTKKADVTQEFDRLVDILMNQGDADVLIDMIPYENQKSFVIGWHDSDDLDQ